jgi:hypothetical protein
VVVVAVVVAAVVVVAFVVVIIVVVVAVVAVLSSKAHAHGLRTWNAATALFRASTTFSCQHDDACPVPLIGAHDAVAAPRIMVEYTRPISGKMLVN